MRPLPLVLAILVVVGGVVAFVLLAGDGSDAPGLDPPVEAGADSEQRTSPPTTSASAPPPIAPRDPSPVSPPVEVRVRIVSRATLAPIADATLRIGPKTRRTAADGIVSVPSGVAFEVIATGFAGGIVRAPAQEAAAPARIALPAVATVAGQVADPRTAPVAGARVRVVPEPRDVLDPEGLALQLPPAYPGLTGGDGSFAVLVPSAVPLAVEALGGVTEAERYGSVLTLVPGQRTSIHLTMHPAGIVRGRVVDETGRALAGARVAVRGTADVALSADRFRRTADTDAEGRFEVASVPLGEWRIEGVAPKSRAELAATVASVRVQRHGQVADQTVTLRPGRFLTGDVVDPDGASIAGIDVVGTWPGVAAARTGPTGSFRIGPIPPGRFRIRALGRGALGGSRWSDTPEDEAVAIQLRLTHAGRVTVAVVDAAAAPVAASVELRSLAWASDTAETTQRVDTADGSAHFASVAEGRYVATVRDEARLAFDGPFTVEAGAETARTVTLRDGAFTTIVVRQPTETTRRLERIAAKVRCDGVVIAAASVGALKTILVPAGRDIVLRVEYRQGGVDRHIEYRLRLTSGVNEFVEVP